MTSLTSEESSHYPTSIGMPAILANKLFFTMSSIKNEVAILNTRKLAAMVVVVLRIYALMKVKWLWSREAKLAVARSSNY